MDTVFRRTNGKCHICREPISRNNYGTVGKIGSWEIDHSKPRARGGSDHANNLYAACVTCNRRKGKSSTRTARAQNGYKSAPYSSDQKTINTVVWGVGGALIGRTLLSALGPAGVLLGVGLGIVSGILDEPD